MEELYTKFYALLDETKTAYKEFRLPNSKDITISIFGIRQLDEVYSSTREDRTELITDCINFMEQFRKSFMDENWSDRLDGEKAVETMVLEELKFSAPFLFENPEISEQIEKVMARGTTYKSPIQVMAMILSKVYSAASVVGWKFDENAKFISTNRKDIQFVSVRPCGEEYENKTYLGILLGDIATSVSGQIQDKKIVIKPSMLNPTIYIPETKTIVFGFSSWWGRISKPEDLKTISDQDINSLWYVEALKAISK